VPQERHVEIDQQTDRPGGETKVRKQLCVVNAFEPFDGLQFQDDRILDKEIDAISSVEEQTFIGDWNRLLVLESQPTAGQLVPHASRVRRFQQAGTHLSMDLNRSTNDPLGQLLEPKHLRALRVSAVIF
jgi:hypothetical protein